MSDASYLVRTLAGAVKPICRSRAAREAARMIEEVESSQDGYQPWTPLYRAKIEQLVDLSITLYGDEPR